MRPVLSYTRIREFAERWTWTDRRTGILVTGYDPPKDAIDPQHVPFLVTFLTSEGIPYRAQVKCVGVNTAAHSRNLVFLTEGKVYRPSAKEKTSKDATPYKTIPVGEIRQVSDLLIVEIDGARFVANT